MINSNNNNIRLLSESFSGKGREGQGGTSFGGDRKVGGTWCRRRIRFDGRNSSSPDAYPLFCKNL